MTQIKNQTENHSSSNHSTLNHSAPNNSKRNTPKYNNSKHKRPAAPSFKTAQGKIPYGMTNDYMFRAVLQSNNKVRRGLIRAISINQALNHLCKITRK